MTSKEPEEIEYKPFTTGELLSRMKDAAMLMVDLSYAALMLKDKELANEVLELGKEIDTLNYHLQTTVMLATRDAEDAKASQSILKIAALTNRISDYAENIVDMVLRDEEVHSTFLEGLKIMDEPIALLQVTENSTILRKSLKELKIRTKIGVSILAIKRGLEWILNPDKNESFYPGDILIARGGSTGIEKLRELVNPKT
ncbi:potassium channel protein [Candidatus Bathyarchaeota archaeon]|nr:potassium channel protein [Candidatus Bathyarchaeota archaeon]